MGEVMELRQVIYGLLAAQIELSTYHYKGPLPKVEGVSQRVSVSLDTVQAAYYQLKIKRYITLTKKAGATVAVQSQKAEFERNIQAFFTLRKEVVIGICKSFGSMFSQAQWYGLKNAGPEQMGELERLRLQTNILRPYIMVQHIQSIYGSLNNQLLLRLT